MWRSRRWSNSGMRPRMSDFERRWITDTGCRRCTLRKRGVEACLRYRRTYDQLLPSPIDHLGFCLARRSRPSWMSTDSLGWRLRRDRTYRPEHLHPHTAPVTVFPARAVFPPPFPVCLPTVRSLRGKSSPGPSKSHRPQAHQGRNLSVSRTPSIWCQVYRSRI